jgi:hypothetical protein
MSSSLVSLVHLNHEANVLKILDVILDRDATDFKRQFAEYPQTPRDVFRNVPFSLQNFSLPQRPEVRI